MGSGALSATDIAYGRALLALGAITPDRLRACSQAALAAAVPLREYLVRSRLVSPEADRAAVGRASGRIDVRAAASPDPEDSSATVRAPLPARRAAPVSAGVAPTLPPGPLSAGGDAEDEAGTVAAPLVRNAPSPADSTATADAALDDAHRTTASPTSSGPPPPPSAGWSAQSLVGTSLGDWTVERVLGQGAMGAVVAAHHGQDRSRRAAIKVPKLSGSDDGDAKLLARFQAEAEAVRKVHGAGDARHVVGFLGADLAARPFPWLALELVEGGDLGQKLKALGKVPFDETVRLALGVCAGLVEAHRVGVVHRDLKPENVLENKAGEVRVADFGVARALSRKACPKCQGELTRKPMPAACPDCGSREAHRACAPCQETFCEDAAEFGITMTGNLVGTPHYMSPEQIDGVVSPKGDMYSFGAMLFAMLAGRPPFRGGMHQVVHAHLVQPPPPLGEYALVPPELAALVSRLMDKEGARRPTAPECLEALRAIAKLRPPAAPEKAGPAGGAVELKPGDRLGDYRIEAELGRGGMGIVYRARGEDGRGYALKVAGLAFSNEEEARKALQRDFHNAERVPPHAAIARALELGEEPRGGTKVLYTVCELVLGLKLETIIQSAGLLDEASALAIWKGVAQGVGAIHRAGVLHLDLSPANVMLAGVSADDRGEALKTKLRSAQPKIIDFGISKKVESQTLRSMEGNPTYASPEQIKGEALTPGSDIYQLGACFYHATTGRPPFAGEHMVMMNKHVHEAPPWAELEDPRLGPDLALVIHRCLFKDPAHRYASVDELVADLERVGRADFPRGALKRAWDEEHARLNPPRFPRWAKALVAATVALVLSLAGGWAWQSSQQAEQQALVRAAERYQDLLRQARAVQGPAELGTLVEAVRGVDPGAARLSPEQTDALGAEVATAAGRVVEQLAERTRAARALLATDPRRCAGTAATLRDDELARLRAALADAGAALRAALTPRLDALDAELAALPPLCEVRDLLQQRQWSAAAAALEALSPSAQGGRDGPPEPPSAAQGDVAAPVRAEVQAALERLRTEVAALTQRVRAAVAERNFVTAEEALAAYRTGPSNPAAFAEAEAALAALAREVQEAKRANPLEDLADAEADRVDARLAELYAGRGPDDPERRAGTVRAYEELLGRTIDGRARALEATRRGASVARTLQALAEAHRAAARAAWEALEAGTRDVWARPASPEKFQALEAAYRGVAALWLEATGTLATDVPALRDAALARVASERAAAVEGGVAEAEASLRRHDLRAAAAAAAVARSLGTLVPAHAARLDLVARQVQLFERLDRELVEVRIPDGCQVGESATSRLYPLRTVGAAALRVDRYETTVETYALFLDVARAQPGDHRAALGCSPDEPERYDHEPLEWPAQVRAQADLAATDASARLPVAGTSWLDAYACAAWAGRRLLAPDEWEAVARGPAAERDRQARWRNALAPVGARADRSPAGVDDAAGNVAEWTSGREGDAAVHRGPHVQTQSTPAFHRLWLAARAPVTERRAFLGFRCALRSGP